MATKSDRNLPLNMLHLNSNNLGWMDLHDRRFPAPAPSQPASTLIGTVSAKELASRPIAQDLDKMSTEAVKLDNGKPDWSLVPFEALEGMVKVLEFGAKKYSRNNWMTSGGFSYRRVLTACMRHLFAYLSGEDNDPESGLSHIHHAQCNLLFLAMYITDKEKFNKDDRERRANVR